MLIQVVHANGYMLQKCYKFTAHATGDNGRRSCVTNLYKLLMLLVVIVYVIAFIVYTSCSCYWLHATEAVTSLLLMLPVIIVAEAVLRIYTSCSCY